jgi:DUF2924 family protein
MTAGHIAPGAPVVGVAAKAAASRSGPFFGQTGIRERDPDGVPPDQSAEAPTPKHLDGDLVRRRWRSLIGRHPPKTISHVLMDRILAWREQVVKAGDISSRSRTILAAALAGKAASAGEGLRTQQGEDNEDGARNRHRPRAPVRVGAALFREHAGVLHRVTVDAEGFEWEGRMYTSLSAVARAITGVRWNGPRYFGLDRGARQVLVRKASEQGDHMGQALRAPNEPSETSGDGGGP